MYSYMLHALELSKKAFNMGEVPVGAVIVKNDTGKIIGEGYNKRESEKNPLAHAEILAISEASRFLNSWRLNGCTLYVTLEPCPMCAGAIINSRLDKVVFGAFDPKAGSIESVINLFSLPYNHKPEILAGIMEKQCSGILKNFFEQKR